MWSVTFLDSGRKVPNLTEIAARSLAVNLSNWNIKVRVTNEETQEFKDYETYEESAKRWSK